MRIAFLIPTIDRIGGAERQTLLLARGFAMRNWSVSVIALSGTGGEAAAELKSQGIAFLSLQMRKGLADPRGWIRLSQWINAQNPDILHANLPHAALMARFCRLAAPVRVLIETIHSPATGDWLRRLAYRLSAGQVDAVSAVSYASAEPWLAQQMIGQSHLAIVANGIDLDHWRCDAGLRRTARHHLGFRDEFVWLSVGRLHPVKDHATLLRAFAKISGNARLLIAGAGPLESTLRREAAALGIEDKALFLGFQKDVLPWMQAADAFVLSSRWEGLPLAQLEAAACGLPAVFTDIPAIHELFPEHDKSRIVRVGDSDGLAAAMKGLMESAESDRRALGESLRESVVARFNITSVLDRWEKTYHALIAMKPYPTRRGSHGRPAGKAISNSTRRRSPAC